MDSTLGGTPMNRRTLLQVLVGTALAGVVPGPFPFSAFAAERPDLPIPNLLRPDASGIVRLKLRTGQTLWRGRPTPTWGINGPLLGPTIVLRRGQKARLEVENTLPEDTAIHWHGLEVPGTSDGGPQAVIAPGAVWSPDIVVDQPAATCWYHPHPHAKTGRHVAMGLGGFLILEDEHSAALPLPNRPGLDDVPVILQDRRLNAEDRIDYTMDVVSAAVGWFGDMLLANGVLYPRHVAPRGLLRLRLLNGCNARTLRLAAADGRPLYVVASDGGFLPEPVKLSELTIFPAERFEVLVDCADGKEFDLVSLPVRQMGMALPPFDAPLPVLRIRPSTDKGSGTLPERLVSLPAPPSTAGLPTRTLKLSMDPRLDMQGMRELMRRYGPAAMSGMSMSGMDHGGDAMGHGGGMMGGGGGMMSHGGEDMPMSGHGSMGGAAGPFDLWRANFINDRAFVMNQPAFDVRQGQYERWLITGKGDMMSHPFHIHGTQFRILSENEAPPAPHRAGWKDVVHVENKQSEVLVRFNHPAPKERSYMAHCHLLEHEDTGMMLSFTVTP